MMLVDEMLNPSDTAQMGALYCLPTCERGRADDGSMMVACDACDNWFHPGCCGGSAVSSADDDSFVCPLCLESQADEYLNDTFGNDTEALLGSVG